MTFLLKHLRGIALLVGLLVVGGCATTDSDMPWNTPQNWEGSPSIPGLSGGAFDGDGY